MNRRQALGVAAIAVPLLAVIVVAIVLFTQATAPRPTGADPTVDRHLAKIACETAVERELVAPATARYVHEVTGESPWTVTGTVDSQNALGAVVRSSYSCTVDREDGKMVATVDSLG